MRRAAFSFCILFLTILFLQNQRALAATGGWGSQMPGQTNPALHAVDFDGLSGIAVGTNGTAFRTTDGGKNWETTSLGTLETMKDVAFVHSFSGPTNLQTAWTVGGGGKIIRSSDNGLSWISLTSGTNQPLESVFFTSVNLGWAVGAGTALKTTNGGTSWTSMDTGSGSFQDIFFVDQNTGWIVGNDGRILKTTNGGASWSVKLSGTTNHLQAISFTDASVGYAVGSGKTILKTVDGGETWSNITPNLPPLSPDPTWTGVDFIGNGTEGWIVGSTGQVVHTQNGGANWTVTTISESALTDIKANSASALWTVDSAKGNVYRYDTIAPSAPTGLQKNPAGNPSKQPTPIFSWSPSLDGETSIAHYEVRMDESAYSSNGTNTSYGNIGIPIEDGTHTFFVRSVDVAGNKSSATTLNFIIDTTLPSLTPVTPSVATAGTPVNLSTTYTDAGTDTITATSCMLFVSGSAVGTMTPQGTDQMTRSHTFPSAGSYSVYTSCTDSAGNVGTSTPVNIQVTAAAIPQNTGTTVSANASTINSSLNSVPADNGSIATISVTVKNASGVALSGKTVTLSTSRPSTDTMVAVSAITDINGRATFTVRSSSEGASNVTAMVDGVLIGPTSILFTAWPPSSLSSPPPTTQATPGNLVKIACPTTGLVAADHPCKAVYYHGADGKRHAFPNEKVYFTWYADFTSVMTVSSQTLASLPLGKNVTYRPGVKMVKFQTLNNVYAISKNNVLRWVKDEDIARSLYGAAWNKQIDDIADTFYLDYRLGQNITSTTDYSPTAELNGALTIDATL
jgi:photosystem II stability/assembly factor-like uncharacterized protein